MSPIPDAPEQPPAPAAPGDPGHKLRILVSRVIYWDESLQVRRRHGNGFRATCSCGWHGRLRDRRGTAWAEAAVHREDPERPA